MFAAIRNVFNMGAVLMVLFAVVTFSALVKAYPGSHRDRTAVGGYGGVYRGGNGYAPYGYDDAHASNSGDVYEDDVYEDDVYEDDVYEDDVYEDDVYEDDDGRLMTKREWMDTLWHVAKGALGALL
ncbi:hypothetical protein AX774_g1361 [Zancudomyces culisetae]|uniref:Uncharacterized protein n=1 Tax=Zancudomyces culisetae TaxID=1213189 RepID=A0A1R1PVX7_ZANCU|nr:hypothetical protein AX774_g1361 [Zancudomyces culisetae]|eukprot:OMH85094.1 hypothetical protein AX774_g1361 [Zancudomyces culisetae]